MRLADSLIRIIDKFYVRPLTRIVSRRMFRYAVCGGANMVLDLMWYFLIYHFVVAERYIDLGVVVVSPHVAALVVVFPITFFTGFWLNRNGCTGVGTGCAICHLGCGVAVAELCVHKALRRGVRRMAHTRQGAHDGRVRHIQLSCGALFHLCRPQAVTGRGLPDMI